MRQKPLCVSPLKFRPSRLCFMFCETTCLSRILMQRIYRYGASSSKFFAIKSLPPIPIGQQARLVIVEFLARFRREFKIRPLDNGIDRARFLTEPAIDAFDHVDVIARWCVLPRPREAQPQS